MARVPLAGTSYIPGKTEERTLAEIKALLEKHLKLARKLVNGSSHGLERFIEAFNIGDALLT